MSTKLQIAVDVADTKRILEIASEVNGVVDILEVGTPVIMKEGMLPVRELKARFPGLTVLADSKIVDGGSLEAGDICEAGADILTVLAMSDDATVQDVVKVAHKYGRKAMADLICVRDIASRAKELVQMGTDIVCVHTGVDMQRQGRTPLKDLMELVSAIPSEKAAVAGGISLETLPQYQTLNPGIVIAGSALYNAPDIHEAAVVMKEVIQQWN